MNKYFLESILLVLLYRTLGMIIVERATRIDLFYIFRSVTKGGKSLWEQGSDGVGVG